VVRERNIQCWNKKGTVNTLSPLLKRRDAMRRLRMDFWLLVLSTVFSLLLSPKLLYATDWKTTYDNALKDDTEAQYNLGVLLVEGKEVKQDFGKAVYWFTQVAQKGHFKAQFMLGERYSRGEGVKKDYIRAFEWYGKAAISDYKPAKDACVALYDKGLVKNTPENNQKCNLVDINSYSHGYFQSVKNINKNDGKLSK
jgi:Sel1 repeat